MLARRSGDNDPRGRRQRLWSHTRNRDKGRGEAAAAAQQQAGLPGERALLQPPVCPSSPPCQTNGSAKERPNGRSTSNIDRVHAAGDTGSCALLVEQQSCLPVRPSSGASLAAVSNQIVVLINLRSAAYTQDK